MNNEEPNTRVGRHAQEKEAKQAKATPKSPFYGESRAARKADKVARKNKAKGSKLKNKGPKKPHKKRKPMKVNLISVSRFIGRSADCICN